MADAKVDDRVLNIGEKSYKVSEMKEESQMLYNQMVMNEQLIKRNQIVLAEISMMIEGLNFKRNDLLTQLQSSEPLLQDNDDQKETDSKAEKKDK